MSIIGAPEALPSNNEVWQEQAVCRSVDPEAWFPEKGQDAKAAKRICARCPVQTQCLQFALDNHEAFGIFGGLSTRERTKLRKSGVMVTEPLVKSCKGCGEAFRPNRARTVYCSRACWRNNEAAAKRRTCVQCGVRFTGSTACCSEECRLNRIRPRIRDVVESPGRYPTECRSCGIEFNATHHRTRYCSDPCRTKADLAQQRSRYHGEIA